MVKRLLSKLLTGLRNVLLERYLSEGMDIMSLDPVQFEKGHWLRSSGNCTDASYVRSREYWNSPEGYITGPVKRS